MPIAIANAGLPGYGTEVTSSSKTFLRSMDRYSEKVGGVVVDGTKSRDTLNSPDVGILTNGTILGKITTGGLYRPTVIGILVTATTAATVTSVTVTAAVATEFARLIVLAGGNVSAKLIGPPSGGGTVASTAITVTAASGTTLTVSSVTTPVIIANSIITAADGSETPRAFLNSDYGLRVTDPAGSSVYTPVAKAVISGDIQEASVNTLAAMNADCATYLFGLLNTEGRTFTRSSTY